MERYNIGHILNANAKRIFIATAKRSHPELYVGIIVQMISDSSKCSSRTRMIGKEKTTKQNTNQPRNLLTFDYEMKLIQLCESLYF